MDNLNLKGSTFFLYTLYMELVCILFIDYFQFDVQMVRNVNV